METLVAEFLILSTRILKVNKQGSPLKIMHTNLPYCKALYIWNAFLKASLFNSIKN